MDDQAASPLPAAPRPSWWQRHGRQWLLNLGMVLIVLVGMHFWQTRDMTTGAAPHVAFERADQPGLQQTLDAWRQQHAGEPVVLYFWATWCPICKAEQPMIGGMVRAQPVLPVAMQSGTAATIAAHEQKNGLRWNSAVDANAEIAQAFGVQATPSFVIIGANGQISSRTVGLTSPWGLKLRLWWARLAG